jgi:hypothetical protein
MTISISVGQNFQLQNHHTDFDKIWYDMKLKATPNSHFCTMAGNYDVAKGKISRLVATLILLECGSNGKHRKQRDHINKRKSGNNSHIKNSKKLLDSLNCTFTPMEVQKSTGAKHA